MSEITINDIENEITPDVVAARCRSYEFKGKPINPFSKTRQVAARCMGSTFFLGRAQQDERGVYAEMFADAVIVLWLCVVDESRAIRACANGKLAFEEAFTWWAENGGGFGSEEEREALDIYGKIVQDLMTVAAQVDSTGKKGMGDALGE